MKKSNLQTSNKSPTGITRLDEISGEGRTCFEQDAVALQSRANGTRVYHEMEQVGELRMKASLHPVSGFNVSL